MRQAIDAYAEGWRTGDAEPWLALFSKDAIIEDPVGSAPHVGIDAIQALWRSVHRRMQLELQIHRVAICGSEAMAAFDLHVVDERGKKSVIDVVDIFGFDGDGRITSVRAYWDAACIRRP